MSAAAAEAAALRHCSGVGCNSVRGVRGVESVVAGVRRRRRGGYITIYIYIYLYI